MTRRISGRLSRNVQLIICAVVCALAVRVTAQSPTPFDPALERYIWKPLGPWAPLVNNSPSSAAEPAFDGDEPIFDIFGDPLFQSPYTEPGPEVTDWRAWSVTAFEDEFNALQVGECTFSQFGDWDEYNQPDQYYGYDGPRARVCKGAGNSRLSPPAAAMLSPVGLAVYGTRVYVSDNFNHRVTAFDFFGNPIALANKIGTGVPGRGNQSDYANAPAGHMLNAPEGLAVDTAGKVIVADGYNARIAAFDSDGAFQFDYDLPPGIASWFKPSRVAITPGATLSAPGTTAADPNARFVAIDSTHCQVSIMDAAFNVVKTLPSQMPDYVDGPASCTNPEFATPGPGEFSTVTGVAIDSASRIYISDHAMNVVQVFDKDGVTIGWIGKPGVQAAPGELLGPVGLAFDHLGRLGVIDAGNSRTVFYSLSYTTGSPVATFEFELDTTLSVDDFPMALVEQVGPSPVDNPLTTFNEATLNDPKGRFLATDPLKRRVLRFELPEIAIVDASAEDGTGNFMVAVPKQKIGTVMQTVVTAVPVQSSGVSIDAPGLTPTGTFNIPAGSAVPFTFPYTQSVPLASFALNAKGDPSGPNYLANADEVIVSSVLECDGCAAEHVVYDHPATGTPVPATLHPGGPNGDWYGREVFVRITPTPGTGPGSTVTHIQWYATGPLADLLGETTTITPVTGGFVDVVVRVQGASTLVYVPVTENGGQGVSTTVDLPVDLEEPGVEITDLTPPSGTDAAGREWNNTDVEGTWAQEDEYSGPIVQDGSFSFAAGDSPEGRDFEAQVTLADYAGHSVARSTAAINGGRFVNIDRTAPVIVANNVTVTANAGGYAILAPSAFGLSVSDPLLNDLRPGSTASKAGSGVNGSVTLSQAANFHYPIGVTTVTFTATDYAGNQTQIQRTVTVNPRPDVSLVYTGQVTVRYGSTLQVSAAVLPSSAEGQVTFSFASRTTTAGLGAGAIATGAITSVVNNVGTYTMTVSYSGSPNLDPISITVPIQVDPAPLTIKADPKTRLYGVADPALTYQVIGTLYNGNTVTGALTRVSGNNVGDYAINRGSVTVSSNYAVTYEGANFRINARPLTITADPKVKSLLAPDPALTYQVTSGSLVAGDSLTGALSRDPGEVAGAYNILLNTLTAGTNYVISYVGAQLTIGSVVIVIESDPITKTYGDVDPPLTYRIVQGVLPIGVSFSGSLVRQAGEVPGNYSILIGNLSLPLGISLTFNNVGGFRITKRAATVTAGNGSKTFGTPDPAIAATGSNFLAADLSGITMSAQRLGGEGAGTYSTVPSATGAALDFYQVGYVSGTFTINKATVQVTARPAAKIYGDPNPAFSFDYGPLPGGLTAANIQNPPTCAASSQNAGTQQVVCSGGFDEDVTFVYVNAPFTVSRRPATLIAATDTKVFGVADPALTPTQSGILTGDLSAITLTGTRTAGADAGSYATSVTAAGSAAANYEFTVTPGTLTITKATPTIAITGGTFVYNGAARPATCTVTGIGGATLTGTLTYVPGPSAPVAAGVTSASCAFAGNVNYNAVSSSSASIEIQPKPLTITAASRSKTYGQLVTFAGTEHTASGLVAGDTISLVTLTSTGAPAAASAAGSPYAIVPSAAVGTGLSNYAITYANGSLTVNKATLTIKADDKTKVQGAANPELTYTVTGFANGESAAVLTGVPVLATTATTGSGAGNYPISVAVGTMSSANYQFAFTNGTLTVTPGAGCSVNGYTTYSQGGWGNNGAPGQLMAANFAQVYPTGSVTIGGSKTLKFTSASAIQAFLPQGGTPYVLLWSSVNPTSSTAGNLAAQVLALRLAVDYSAAGVLKTGLGQLVMLSGPFAGKTVNEILATANAVLGGATSSLPSGMSISQLNGIIESLNLNFHEGTTNAGLLGCAVANTCVTGSFTLNGNSATSGQAGNIRSYSANGVNVKVSAFAKAKSNGAWSSAYLGAWAPGVGVTDGSEDGSGSSHMVDNEGDRVNYLLFEFSQPVVVTKAYLDYVGADSDAIVWVGTKNDPYNNHQTLNDAFLAGLGAGEENAANSGDTRWAQFNGTQTAGNVLVIAANPTGTNDSFKVGKLTFSSCPGDVETCTTGAVATIGNSSLNGSSGNIRSFSGNGVNMKVSAFARAKSNGSWSASFLGAWSVGMGVTDGSEDGDGDSHKVDNIGDRVNYVLFEFDSPVKISKAYLSYLGADADAKVWIGTKNNPYANHQVLSDAFLNSLTGESVAISSTAAQWVSFNSAAVSGNVIVIAADPNGSNDAFKINKIEFTNCDDGSTPANRPPTVSVQDRESFKKLAVSVQVSGSDPDDDALTYTATGLPTGLSMSATGLITGTPTVKGVYDVTVTVKDPSNAQDSDTFEWEIVNRAPTLTTSNRSDNKGTSANVQITGADADGDALTYSATGLPTGASISSSGKITGTLSAAGTYTVTVTAKDVDNATASSTFTWTVVAPNVAPDAKSDSVTAIKNTTRRIIVLSNDTDSNDDDLTVTSNTTPSSSVGTITRNSDGSFTYVPKRNYTGTFSFSYTVSDGRGGTDTATVTVQVRSSHSSDDGCHDH